MKLPRIQIRTTDIQMDYTITKPFQRIEQPKADLHIEQPEATIQMSTTNAKLQINNDQLWRDLGMKPTSEVISEYAQKGREKMLKGISRRVREGRQMMEGAGKGQGSATIQSIAAQNHGPKRPGPYNIKFIPSYNAVKINIIPGTLNINIERNKPIIDVRVNKPKMDFTYGDVHGKMVVRPDVEIDVTG